MLMSSAVMASRRLAEVALTVPPNVTTLEFQRSDGDSRLWPTNTTRTVDEEGQVNFMRHLDLDAPTSIKWRLQVARAISIDKKMPENQDYVLANWPEEYKLFDHNKGPHDNPRHDVYLFGSPRGRFRSINEFIPHAIWLMRDESMEHSSCLCKYCSKKAQKEITASMSNILRSSPTSASPSPSRARTTPRDKKPHQSVPSRPRDRGRDSRTYAAVQRRPEVSKQAMLVERNSDLRAIFSRTEMKLKRWFREGELVWCALDRSISQPDLPEDASIKLWPALIDETRLKSHAMKREGESSSRPYSAWVDEDVLISEAKGGTSREPPWTILQYYSYKVRLLVTNNTLIVPGDRILPYQAHAPSNALINAMGTYPPDKLELNREALHRFNPCADEQVDFEQSIAPYAMALQIGGALSAYWCLTDEWTTTFTVPGPTRPPAPDPSSTVTSLQDAIAQAYRHNAQNQNPAAETTAQHRNGPRFPEPGTQVAQIRYQGLWWGGERIWTDDFIRLKVPRRCLAPAGADNVSPPSGPGKAAKERWLQQGRDLSELGAGARGIFMRLDALIVVDVGQPDGQIKKECRACGMLYELADIDWDEAGQEPRKQSNAATAPGDSRAAVHNDGAPPVASAASEIPQPWPIAEFSLPVISATPPMPTKPLMSDSDPKRSATPSRRFLFPEAPQGYRFRPILPVGHEAVLSLSLISGRYYPRILSHPLLDDALMEAISRPPELGGLSDSNNLWALEGLSAGFYNSVDPTYYKATRSLMVEEAGTLAAQQLEEYRARFSQREEDSDELQYPMEVDV